VQSPADLEAAGRLFREYLGWLLAHREVTAFSDAILERGRIDFEREISNLPGEYADPGGGLLLAVRGRSLVGCGAFRRVREGVAELKRIYVRSGARGFGVGRRLTLELLDRVRRRGYRRVVLDTLPTMTAAIALYRSLGFRPVRAYWPNPVPGALFFGLSLRRRPGDPLPPPTGRRRPLTVGRGPRPR
jgi:putative acetyltransferase